MCVCVGGVLWTYQVTKTWNKETRRWAGEHGSPWRKWHLIWHWQAQHPHSQAEEAWSWAVMAPGEKTRTGHAWEGQGPRRREEALRVLQWEWEGEESQGQEMTHSNSPSNWDTSSAVCWHLGRIWRTLPLSLRPRCPKAYFYTPPNHTTNHS